MSTWPPTPAPLTPITYASFQADFPEFSDATVYPASAFNWYFNQAATTLNACRWGLDYNQGFELFIAHHLMLYKRRQDTAALSGYPGMQKGNINSETPGQVSLSYDTVIGVEEGGGFWNQTEYGVEFIRRARLHGMGPIQANVGPTAGAVGQVQSFMAWPGPPTGNGYSF